MDLFDLLADERQTSQKPLAERLRPQSVQEFVGFESLGEPFQRLLEKQILFSVIFWGPPGCGKTTLARLLARNAKAEFIELSAIGSGVKELREILATAKDKLRVQGVKTVLFLDEIHHYNKTQQDALLRDLEQGNIVLIGATTENPAFQVIPALLSRVQLLRLPAVSQESLQQILQQACNKLDIPALAPEVEDFLLRQARGDARSILALLELASHAVAEEQSIDIELLEALSQQSRINYDDDGHYDHASAYQKSMRGCAPDAALYWLGKMIVAGEDPRFIARRLLVTASEDVGLADPMAVLIAQAACEAVDRLGMPEARIHLAQATVYVAQAPKSNKAYAALDQIIAEIKAGHNYQVPPHLRDAHYARAKDYGHGAGYIYSHSDPEAQQDFMPAELIGKSYLSAPES